MFSEQVKSIRQSRRGAASTSVVFQLPSAEQSYAVVIGIERWLGLPIDCRAPVGSVVLLELVDGCFLALVVDTVAGRPRWLVEGSQAQLASLYDGVFDCEGGARNALVITAPQLGSSLTRVQIPDEQLIPVMGFDGGPCDQPRVMAAIRSPDPGGGSPGVLVDPAAVAQAEVLSDVTGGLAGATRVRIRDVHGRTRDALLVASGALL